MVTDQQIRRLVSMKKETLTQAADKSGMSEKTARKYLKANKLPSELKNPHTWKTHEDAFEEVWPHIKELLELNAGLEATTVLPHLQTKYPCKFQETQLRTLQRRIKNWRVTEGPEQEVMFEQIHYPGDLAQTDFTHMDDLGITILGEHFKHMVFHFVLTYSNWENVKICSSESFESLSEGVQDSVWKLGGSPKSHQTDQLTAAVSQLDNKGEFTERYEALLRHYGMEGKKIQVGKPNENGDIEQRHHRFKRAVKQALMLRGSTEFNSKLDYEEFLKKLLSQLNSGRQVKFEEEQSKLNALPLKKLDALKRITVSVRSGSTISIDRNVYSVNSRLIGEKVDAMVFFDRVEIWLGQKKQDEMPRLIGKGKALINYRHIIHSLIRKPGAFRDYRYRDELFPTSRFRRAYDWICKNMESKSSKEYLSILHLAATVNEARVDDAINWLFNQNLPIEYDFIEDLVTSGSELPSICHIKIPDPQLHLYDTLLSEGAA